MDRGMDGVAGEEETDVLWRQRSACNERLAADVKVRPLCWQLDQRACVRKKVCP